MIEFQPFPKIPRYRRQVIVTEKLDGTNAAVRWEPIAPENDPNILAVRQLKDQHGAEIGLYALLAQSRQQFIVPARILAKSDNHGFAGWVDQNVDELAKLGPGIHYGEWWGFGIQRGYGAPEKRFSLFNVSRWGAHNPNTPACCHVVPVLGQCLPEEVGGYFEDLRWNGSKAIPGYMRPEGVVVWHTQSRHYYKILLENDEGHKGVKEAA